jgi:hypothetical protein
MILQSQLFQGDPKLEAAAISDPAHILLGAWGPHVGKIQMALIQLDGANIAEYELQRQAYGASTAAAGLPISGNATLSISATRLRQTISSAR